MSVGRASKTGASALQFLVTAVDLMLLCDQLFFELRYDFLISVFSCAFGDQGFFQIVKLPLELDDMLVKFVVQTLDRVR